MAGKGSNSVKLRQYNERFVLDAIRRMREASKSDLARAANLTPAAVADIVDGLEGAGFIQQTGRRSGQRGSPSVLYGINAERVFSIGVKIGRRALEAILVDFSGAVRAQKEHGYDFPDPDVVARAGDAAIAEFRAAIGRSPATEIVGLGLASPYFLGGWSEELDFPADLGERWEAVDLTTLFDIGPNMPVFVENDATSSALAELMLGSGGRFQDFMHISVDTFVGGGLVQAGRVHTGPHGNSAALGPLPVSPSSLDSMASRPARYTSLLHRASIYVLVNHLRAHGVRINRVRELDPLPEGAERPVREWLEDCARALVEAIIAITSVIDLEAIILDSILPRPLHAQLMEQVRAHFDRVSAIGIVPPQILSGKFGPQASPIGAAMLPIAARLAPDSSVLMLGKRANKLAGSLSGSIND